jgi:hypothetical protein
MGGMAIPVSSRKTIFLKACVQHHSPVAAEHSRVNDSSTARNKADDDNRGPHAMIKTAFSSPQIRLPAFSNGCRPDHRSNAFQEKKQSDRFKLP